jgi:hypothetical protein
VQDTRKIIRYASPIATHYILVDLVFPETPQTNNDVGGGQGSCHQEDQGNNSQTGGEANGQQDAEGEGARNHLGVYDRASNANNGGVSKVIPSNQQVLGILTAQLHRHRITMALVTEWKSNAPPLLPSLPPFNLPLFDLPPLDLKLLLIPLLSHLPPILEEGVTPFPPLDVAPGRIMKIWTWSSRIMVVLRSGYALTHLEGLPVQSNPTIKTIWNRRKTLGTRSHPRQRQARAVRAVRVVRVVRAVRVNERGNRLQVPIPKPRYLARQRTMEQPRFCPTTIFPSPLAYPSCHLM